MVTRNRANINRVTRGECLVNYRRMTGFQCHPADLAGTESNGGIAQAGRQAYLSVQARCAFQAWRGKMRLYAYARQKYRPRRQGCGQATSGQAT
jgi:hypothetical protein